MLYLLINEEQKWRNSTEEVQIDINTNETLRVWVGAKEVYQALGLPIEAIKSACRGYIVNKSGRHPKTSYGGFK